MSGRDGSWDVEVVVHSGLRLARVVRTVVAAGAVLEGFSIDELDDVRLLVDEAFVTLCGGGSQAVQLRLDIGNGCVVVEMQGDRSSEPVDTSALQMLASAFAVDFDIALDAVPPRFTATLRSAA